MRPALPFYVQNCIDVLCNAGFEAYCVGGSVRDMLMGNRPDDYDITTSADPNSIISLFERSIPTGIAHGTVTVITEGGPVEITTYRSDGEYLDSRHPKEVCFIKNIEQDLLRRDFTMNAIAFNKDRIIDICGGIKDIEKKTIRAVGDPKKRFSEDALRIMRCFRFASTLEFDIEEKTLSAATAQSKGLERVSAERIAVELIKLLGGKNTTPFNKLIEAGGLKFLGLKRGGIDQTFRSLPNTPACRLVALKYYTDCNVCDLAVRLKLSNSLKKDISDLCALLELEPAESREQLKRLLSHYDADILKQSFEMRKTLFCQQTDRIISVIDDIAESGEPYTVSMLDISGKDVEELGIKGKAVGSTLGKLLDICIKTPQMNKKDKLIEYIKQSLK